MLWSAIIIPLSSWFSKAAIVAALSASAGAATVSVNSYFYITSPSGSYPDAGGELTDGITGSDAWPLPVTIDDVVNLSGWDSIDPAIRFDFATATVSSFTVWAADSDGAAGVSLPTSIRLRTLDSSFDQTFSVTDLAGNGSTVPLTFSGFSVTTDSLVVEISRSSQWTMLSEVEFDTIPEPSSAFLVAIGGSVCVFRRRCRKGARV